MTEIMSEILEDPYLRESELSSVLEMANLAEADSLEAHSNFNQKLNEAAVKMMSNDGLTDYTFSASNLAVQFSRSSVSQFKDSEITVKSGAGVRLSDFDQNLDSSMNCQFNVIEYNKIGSQQSRTSSSGTAENSLSVEIF